MRNEKKRFRKLLILLGLFALVALIVFLGFEIFKKTEITKYDFKTFKITCADETQVLKEIESLRIRYLTFKKEELEDRLKKKFYCIGRVNSQVYYPDKLVVEVSNRESEFVVVSVRTNIDISPVITLPGNFQVASESSVAAKPLNITEQLLVSLNQATQSGYFLIDNEGVVFDKADSSINLPRLHIFDGDLKLGNRLDENLIKSVKEIKYGLKNIEAPSDNLVIIADRLIVDSRPRIIFSLKKRLDYQIASLQLILAQAKMNSDPAKTGIDSVESIDLRFNKPVVVYTKKK